MLILIDVLMNAQNRLKARNFCLVHQRIFDAFSRRLVCCVATLVLIPYLKYWDVWKYVFIYLVQVQEGFLQLYLFYTVACGFYMSFVAALKLINFSLHFCEKNFQFVWFIDIAVKRVYEF